MRLLFVINAGRLCMLRPFLAECTNGRAYAI